MRSALTLRLRLLLLWLFTIAVCGALAYVMRSVYQLGAEAQTEKTVALASHACSLLQTEYLRAAKPPPDALDEMLMGALLNVVLEDAPGVEGGFWHDGGGFVAYAFPTHQGSEAKTDVPPTERARLETLVRSSLESSAPAVEMQRGTRENVVMVACPVGAGHLGAWTMARVPIAAGKAYDAVTRGLGLLLAFALGSGLWLGYSFYRWTHHFGRIENTLRGTPGENPSDVPLTGDAELDRVVVALNGFKKRLKAAQAQAAELRASLEREERYAALGRMAASVAHEVRNPIAAIRLKTENAIAEPARKDAALTFVLREVDRLDGIVKTLLSRAEPVRIHARNVKVGDWLNARVDSFQGRCVAKRITLRSACDVECWRFDPDAMGRALDNLIDNALDHIPEGGVIDVRAWSSGNPGVLILRVSDNGPGVAPEVMDRLFEPFVSGRPDGIGLGLAIAREIAEAHSGAAHHVRQSSGACFELEVPWRES